MQLEILTSISGAKDYFDYGSINYFRGNILAICILSTPWPTDTGHQSQVRKYPNLLTNRILNFVECYINYPARVFEMKKLLAIFTLVLVHGCNFYAEQAIKGEKVIKSNNPSVKFNITVSQGVKIKK